VTSQAGALAVKQLVVDASGEVLTYSLSAGADDVNPNVLLGIPEQDALGNGELTLEASGTGVGLDGLSARGILHLADGGVPDIGPLSAVDKALGTSVVGARYKPVEVRFTMQGSAVDIEPFTLESELLKVSGGAKADLDGPLAGRMVVGLPRSEVSEDAGVARNVLDAITNDDQWLNIPVVIGGTLSEPAFGPDGDAIRKAVAEAGKQAARGAAQRGAARLEQEVSEGLQNVLGGRLAKR
jgi:hypothetical protein